MSSIRAIVIDPAVPGRFAIKEVAAPRPGPSEALIQVEAISLNRGEAGMAMMAEAGTRLGWDLAQRIHLKQPAPCMHINVESISSSRRILSAIVIVEEIMQDAAQLLHALSSKKIRVLSLDFFFHIISIH